MQESISQKKKLLIVTFMVCYLTPVVFWNIWPLFSEKPLPRPLRQIMRASGLSQDFHLFAPQPIRQNYYSFGEIRYKDGGQDIFCKRLYKVPPDYLLTQFRYRKLLALKKNEYKGFARDFCRFLREKYSRKDTQIQEVRFMRALSRIPRPREVNGRLQYPEPRYAVSLIYNDRKLRVREEDTGEATPVNSEEEEDNDL